MTTHIAILKAEDSRRYDKTLEDLLKSPNEQIRIRAALAAGRIGNEAAIPALTGLLQKDQTVGGRAMAAFALGEVESAKAADVILEEIDQWIRGLTHRRTTAGENFVVARLVEAAGKIAGANANDSKSKDLGLAIVIALQSESEKKAVPVSEMIHLGLTALLRARPAGADET
ncbi:MAG TPA: HEAT repeat domain-containing protein, partial [Pyrinomonadaceae bacterium]|nr:HEAT repeat domain-containing protein [Pyrinomonadaceae bacterium]